MSKFFIERVEYANGSESFEVKMRTTTGGSVMIMSRGTIEAARETVNELKGKQEVSRQVVG